MIPHEQDARLPEIFVIVASAEDAAALAPLAVLDAEVRPVLVATGPDPMHTDEALDESGALAGRILLTEGPCAGGPVAESVALLPRLDALVADDRPAVIVVRGGSSTAMAATQVAVWRGVPVVHAALALDATAPGSAVAAANQAAIGELVAWQDARTPAGGAVPAARRLVRDRIGPADTPRIVGLASERRRAGLSA